MSNITILFGNGLGMALDPDYFKLEAGLKKAWNSFDNNQQKIISLGTNIYPNTEQALEKHHIISTACKNLFQNQNNNICWLSEEGKQFYELYQNFIYKTAKHYFEYQNNLPDDFTNSLCNFINSIFLDKKTCHIATINYDKLVYKALIDKKILDCYHDGGLVDGIYNKLKVFKEENLIPIYHNFGWYLHLHGSPIFKKYGESICKTNINKNLSDDFIEKEPIQNLIQAQYHDEIVLASPQKKSGLIANSFLLSTYFYYFQKALSGSDRLYIIGYSGNDEHINSAIKTWILENKSPRTLFITIVEWDKSNHSLDDWSDKLIPSGHKIEITIKPLVNILNYNFV